MKSSKRLKATIRTRMLGDYAQNQDADSSLRIFDHKVLMPPRTALYNELPHSRCIRVLRTISCDPDPEHKLFLELSQLDLDDARIAYQALSYTWGPPIDTPECLDEYSLAHDVPILVMPISGTCQSVLIGRNLYEALLNLELRGLHGYFWVDALCINQSNLEEKNHQVSMMGDIYSKADLVIVWVGPDDPPTISWPHEDDPAMQRRSSVGWIHTTVIDDIVDYEKTHSALTPQDVVLGFEPSNPDPGLTIVPLRRTIPACALRDLYKFWQERRYLSRAWIMQEVVLATAPPAILLGQLLLPLWTLSRIASLLQNHVLAPLYSKPSDRGSTVGDGAELYMLVRFRAIVQECADPAFLPRYLSLQYPLHGTDTRLFVIWDHLLRFTYPKHASDPRDMIYSLMSIVSRFAGDRESQPVLVPDYKARVEEVYINFTKALLNGLSFLDVLSLVNNGHETDFNGNYAFRQRLPSWVPDFSSHTRHGYSLQQIYYGKHNHACGYDASKSPVAGLRVFQDAVLKLMARKCMVITQTCTPFSNVRSGSSMAEREIYTTLLAWSILSGWGASVPSTYPTGETAQEAIFRTLADYTSQTDQRSACLGLEERVKNYFAMTLSGAAQYPHNIYLTRLAQQLRDELELRAGQWGIPDHNRIETFLRCSRKSRGLGREHEMIARADKDFCADAVRHQLVFMAHPKQSLFTTHSGYFGKICSKPEIGDQVWLIQGARVPFVLRAVGEGMFRLVGEAYVHGGMYGELAENGGAGESQGIAIV